MNSEVIRYPADLQEKELLNKIKELNKNNKIYTNFWIDRCFSSNSNFTFDVSKKYYF